MTASLGAQYFEERFRENPDPWNFATSSYEAEKYGVTIAALRGRRYLRALEVGCAIGVLTAQLARHCGELYAVDLSPTALFSAQQRCAGLPNILFGISEFPVSAPATDFDLIVLSEVAYYWNPADLERAKATILATAQAGADILLVHWTPFVESYPQSGDQVHDAFLSDPRFAPVHGSRYDSYRLDLITIK